MTAFLVGLICGISIGVVLGFVSSSLFIVGGKDTPVQYAGPRLPHHRNVVAMRKLPEWQEWQRDVDHLEGVSNEPAPGYLKFPEWTPEHIERLERVSRMSRDEAWWTMGEKK